MLLSRSVGFKDCSAELLDELAALGSLRKLSRGEFLMRRGDPSNYVSLLLDGTLEASVMHRDGHRHLVGLMVPGDINGLVGLVDGQQHINDLVARGDITSLMLPTDGVRRLRAREPALVFACERYLAFRSRLLYERISADPAQRLEVRVARMLQMMSTLWGTAKAEGVELDVKLSQTDIADWLGMSRQRVNFVLKKLEAEGLIALGYSAITVRRPGALQELAQD